MSAYKNTSPLGNSIKTENGGKAKYRCTEADRARILIQTAEFEANGGKVFYAPEVAYGPASVRVDYDVGIRG